ncbi:MAG TPA: tetratricopeptide repeat protein [Rhodopila sp.]|nr:tetratricopeptide repeat protein [Rhodopila sp.]
MNDTRLLLKVAAQHYSSGEYPTAEALCRRIIDQSPGHFDALQLLGVLLNRQHRPAEAADYLRLAATLQPHNRQIRTNLANSLLATEQYVEAVAYSDGEDPASLNNHGLALRGLGRLEEAAAAFRQAADPAYAPGWFNLATTLARLGQLEQALDAARTALRVAPADTPVTRLADIANEIGRMLMALGKPDDALAECRVFLAQYPDEPRVTWNMSLALLLLGRFAQGWPLYERRFDVPSHDQRVSGTTVLDPGAVAGKRVLILTEQGRGDMLQMVRYAPLLAEMGATVLMQTYGDLVGLFAGTPGIHMVISTDHEPPEADLRTMAMSLPLAFNTSAENLPVHVPYLLIPPDRAAAWGERLASKQRPRVGLAWSGSKQSYDRSAMPVSCLRPLLALSQFEFHCLQRDIVEADEAWLAAEQPLLHRHDRDLSDFADTAALVGEMDLVITIDTAIAHLTGALGRPVWIMLPFNPDWRWMLKRSDSPWYPTARLFRQTADRGWASVVAAVKAALLDSSVRT